MFNEMKTRVTYAVKEVYRKTDAANWRNGTTVCEYIQLRVPSILDNRQVTVGISRSTILGDLYYKLYTKESSVSPFLTVFGCWPQEWVIDIFCKTLAHYYDIKVGV